MTTKPPGSENGSYTSDILLAMNSQNLAIQAMEKMAERRIAECAAGLIAIQVKLNEIMYPIWEMLQRDENLIIYLKYEKIAKDTKRGIITRIEAVDTMLHELHLKKDFFQREGVKIVDSLAKLKTEAEKLDFKKIHEDLERFRKDLLGKKVDPKVFQERLVKIREKVDAEIENRRPWLTPKVHHQHAFQYFNYDILSPIRKDIISDLNALSSSYTTEKECHYQASMLMVYFDNFQGPDKDRNFANLVKFEKDYLDQLEEPSLILYKLCMEHEGFASVVIGSFVLSEKIEAPLLAEILYKYANSDVVQKMLANKEVRDPLNLKKLTEHSSEAAVWILCSPALMKNLNKRRDFYTNKMFDNFFNALEQNKEDVKIVVETACEDREYAEIVLKILLKINETNPEIVSDDDLGPIFDKYPDLVPKEFEFSKSESTPRAEKYVPDFEAEENEEEEEERERMRLEAQRHATAESQKAKFQPREIKAQAEAAGRESKNEMEAQGQQGFPEVRPNKPKLEKSNPTPAVPLKQATRLPGLDAPAAPVSASAKQRPDPFQSRGPQGEGLRLARMERAQMELAAGTQAGPKVGSKSSAQPGPPVRFSPRAKPQKKPDAGVVLEPLRPVRKTESELDSDPDSTNQPPLP